MDAVLTNREIAVGVWLIGGLLWALTHSGIRRSIGGVLAVAFGPKLSIPALLFALYVTGVVALAKRVGIWDVSLLTDSVIWFFVAGLAIFGKFMQVTEDRFVRHTILAAIAIPELIQYVLGLVSFSLPIELVLFPMIVFLAMLSAVAGLKREHEQVKTLSDSTLGLVGLAMIALTTVQILTSLASFNGEHLLFKFYLPVWLTIASIPFVYLLGVYAHYEVAFISVDFRAKKRRSRRRAKMALLLGFHLRVDAMEEYVREKLHELVGAETLSEARQLIARYRASLGPEARVAR